MVSCRIEGRGGRVNGIEFRVRNKEGIDRNGLGRGVGLLF